MSHIFYNTTKLWGLKSLAGLPTHVVTVNSASGFPEILVTVDFNTLAPFTQGYWQAVRIAVGFGSDNPVANSKPIPLLPGVHLSAAISLVFVQSLVNSNFAALGLMKVFRYIYNLYTLLTNAL